MRVPNLAAAAVPLALLALPMRAAAPVPRNASAFTIVEPGGRHTELSSFKGKVVVIEFMLVRCPHCFRLVRTIAKLQQELGPRGFQPIGVAFDKDIGAPDVADFLAASGNAFPVGYATAEKVDAFLGREASERFQVPQLVVIDRAGTIRAQSRSTGETQLEDEDYLRRQIDSLLKERAPS